jgi:hypothetical protein
MQILRVEPAVAATSSISQALDAAEAGPMIPRPNLAARTRLGS